MPQIFQRTYSLHTLFLQDSEGSNLTAPNLRGVRLFGWKGCLPPAVKSIREAYDDFQKLAKQKALWEDIDWESQAAKEIWGHGSGNKAVTDDRKKQIQREYMPPCFFFQFFETANIS